MARKLAQPRHGRLGYAWSDGAQVRLANRDAYHCLYYWRDDWCSQPGAAHISSAKQSFVEGNIGSTLGFASKLFSNTSRTFKSISGDSQGTFSRGESDQLKLRALWFESELEGRQGVAGSSSLSSCNSFSNTSKMSASMSSALSERSSNTLGDASVGPVGRSPCCER